MGFVKSSLCLEDITAKVTSFRTVPGCGLSVTISHVDEMESKGEQSEKIAAFRQEIHLPTRGNNVAISE